jgi:hypothetical protein
MIKIKYIAVLICIFFSACKNQMKYTEIAGDYTIINVETPVNISIENLIGDYDTVRLESSEESLLKEIFQIYIMNDTLYILDHSKTTVSIFSNTGKYINKIHTVGQGPDEYIQISSFSIDYINKQIVVMDAYSKKIILYDRNGNHEKTVLLNFVPVRIASTTSGFVHFCSEPKATPPYSMFPYEEMETSNVHFFDKKGNFLHAAKQDDTPQTIEIRSAHALINLKDGTFLYQPALSDTIYIVNENSIGLKYVIQSGSAYKIPSYKDRQKISFSLDNKNGREHIKNMIDDKYLFSWGEILDSDDYFYVGFSGLLSNDKVKVYYSKSKDKTITVSSNSIKGNKILADIFLNTPLVTDNKSFYTVIPARIMYDETSAGKLPEGKMKTFLSGTDIDDTNPLLIRFTLNDSIFD